MPNEKIEWHDRNDILSFEEILRVVRIATDLGIESFRITGGEPLVRKGVVDLVAMLTELSGVKDLSMSTNGVLFPIYGKALKEAGLHRVNFSMDSLNPKKFRQITKGNWLAAWKGVETALALGFREVKINCVAMRQINDDEWIDIAKLTVGLPLHVRFIEYMPIGCVKVFFDDIFVPISEVRQRIANELSLEPISDGEKPIGYGPARYFRIPNAKGNVGFIGAVTEIFCDACNRMRLTAGGKIRMCLGRDDEVDLMPILRGGGSDEAIKEAILWAVAHKPKQHGFASRDETKARMMAQIGG